jgi:uroporphyrinogen decarboxylase
MWDLLARYPVNILNWHDRATPPSLAEGRERFPRALLGGIRQWETLLQGEPAEVSAEVADARAQVAGRGLIVGAGCVIPLTTPERNIRAAIDAARGTIP